MKDYRKIIVEPDIAVPGISKPHSIVDTIRNLLRLIENSLVNDDVIGLEIVLKRPLAVSSKTKRRKHDKAYNNASYKFPSTNKFELQKFAMTVKILKLIYSNLSTDQIVTKREIYYQDVSLFGRQRNVDSLVEMLSFSLGVQSHELGIVAAQKGLVYGDLTIVYNDGRTISIRQGNGPTLIPSMVNCRSIILGENKKSVIVVEKEAIFSFLCTPTIDHIIVTGKGYPDRLTQTFMSKLFDCTQNNILRPAIPIYGLVDSDPYGIHILLQYKFGHSTLQGVHGHESSSGFSVRDRAHGCIGIRYIGVHLCEYTGGWLSLSEKDINFGKKVLESLTSGAYEIECLEKRSDSDTSIASQSSFGSSDVSLLSQDFCQTFVTDASICSSDSFPGGLKNKTEKLGKKMQSYGSSLKKDTTIDIMKRELQRQLFFNKKNEMNVIGGEQNNLSSRLYESVDAKNLHKTDSPIIEYLGKKVAKIT